MLRLDEKESLILKYCSVFSSISRYTGQLNPGVRVRGRYMGCLPKKAVRIMHKSLTCDLIKGLRDLNRKIPRYVELPTYKVEGDGMYSEEYDGDNTNSQPKEIIVNELPVVVNQALSKSNSEYNKLFEDESANS